mmetsp:Transcript_18212/g.26506  ORF Transcript_18212/g.26506 Transcript_18212/m.26506 type:complete len:201 (+) Transcript_18212:249-851(+)
MWSWHPCTIYRHSTLPVLLRGGLRQPDRGHLQLRAGWFLHRPLWPRGWRDLHQGGGCGGGPGGQGEPQHPGGRPPQPRHHRRQRGGQRGRCGGHGGRPVRLLCRVHLCGPRDRGGVQRPPRGRPRGDCLPHHHLGLRHHRVRPGQPGSPAPVAREAERGRGEGPQGAAHPHHRRHAARRRRPRLRLPAATLHHTVRQRGD